METVVLITGHVMQLILNFYWSGERGWLESQKWKLRKPDAARRVQLCCTEHETIFLYYFCYCAREEEM